MADIAGGMHESPVKTAVGGVVVEVEALAWPHGFLASPADRAGDERGEQHGPQPLVIYAVPAICGAAPDPRPAHASIVACP